MHWIYNFEAIVNSFDSLANSFGPWNKSSRSMQSLITESSVHICIKIATLSHQTTHLCHPKVTNHPTHYLILVATAELTLSVLFPITQRNFFPALVVPYSLVHLVVSSQYLSLAQRTTDFRMRRWRVWGEEWPMLVSQETGYRCCWSRRGKVIWLVIRGGGWKRGVHPHTSRLMWKWGTNRLLNRRCHPES
jgi:hypothetical protein